MTTYQTGVLCILDGFGYREDATDNAIKLADTPVYDRLWQSVPRAWLKTSGLAVGLPAGQMGNSEVGHMNIGSGRVVMQDLPRIDAAIADKSLFDRDAYQNMVTTLETTGGTAHLFGLMSPGGVHAHQDHLAAIACDLAERNLPVALHLVTDGRDTPPRSALAYLDALEGQIDHPLISIATLGGRYFAMDRDKRWDRIELHFRAIARADAPRTPSARAAIEASYQAEKGDEFINPIVIGDYQGMGEADAFFMTNFRADRVRQILTALTDDKFDGFSENLFRPLAMIVGMVDYSSALTPHMTTLYPADVIEETLGVVLSKAGMPQLRIAETEKYGHVTFFFNGGREKVFQGEDRILIPSPDVATYDLKPEMSAHEVTAELVKAIASRKYGLVIVNFANPDMVGHTGVLSAAIKAVETIDQCLGALEEAVKAVDGFMLVTADHGNVELMKDQKTGIPHTAHTHFDVPALLLNRPDVTLEDGALCDIAPTLLKLLELCQPEQMTGQPLIGSVEGQTGPALRKFA